MAEATRLRCHAKRQKATMILSGKAVPRAAGDASGAWAASKMKQGPTQGPLASGVSPDRPRMPF